MPTAPLHRCKKRSGKIKLVLLLLFLLAAVAAGVKFFLLPGTASQNTDDPREIYAEGTESETTQATEPDISQLPELNDEDIAYVDLGSFLVNLKSKKNMRYLQVEVCLAVTGLEQTDGGGHANKELKLPPADDAIARDTIVKVLSQQSFEHLRAAQSRQQLKNEIRKQLVTQLRETRVVAVLFTSFLMQ